MIAIFCWLLPTVHRLGEIFGWDPEGLVIGATFTSYLQGFLDALVYFNTTPALKLWSTWIGLLIGIKYFVYSDMTKYGDLSDYTHSKSEWLLIGQSNTSESNYTYNKLSGSSINLDDEMDPDELDA